MSSPQIGDEEPLPRHLLRACNCPRNKLSDRFRRKSQNLQQIPDSFSKLPTLANAGPRMSQALVAAGIAIR